MFSINYHPVEIRLMLKLIQKLSLLNLKVKDKLIKLNILEERKESLQTNPKFDEILSEYSQKKDVGFTLNYFINNSRNKFQKELLKLRKVREKILNYVIKNSQNNFKLTSRTGSYKKLIINPKKIGRIDSNIGKSSGSLGNVSDRGTSYPSNLLDKYKKSNL